MFKVEINPGFESSGSEEIQVELKEDQLVVDGTPMTWDKVKIKDNYYHLIIDNQSYTAEVVKVDTHEKTVWLKLSGITFQLKIKDNLDLLLEKLGMNDNNTQKLTFIKAPMPGLILNINVKEGQEVKEGDPIMVLEAMKMENVLKSPGTGVIRKINVKVGTSVEKNYPLIEF